MLLRRTCPVEAVRRAVMLEADLAGAVRRAFAGTLDEARMRLFHPLGFMLASPVETPEEAVERFAEKPAKVKKGREKKGAGTEEDVESSVEGTEATTGPSTRVAHMVQDDNSLETPSPSIEAFLEDKYDGMRAQVHCGDSGQPGRVAIYSRNREDVTESFPELEEAFAQVQPEHDGALIFDGEILGWDLSRRGRCRLRCWDRGSDARGFRMSGGNRCRWCSWRST